MRTIHARDHRRPPPCSDGRPASRRVARVATLALVGLVLSASVAGTAETKKEPEKPAAVAAPVAIPALEIPARAESTTRELYRLRATLGGDPDVARVEAELSGLQANLEQLDRDTSLGSKGLTGRDFEDITRQWRREEAQLTDGESTVARRLKAIETGIATVRDLDQVWRLTADKAAQEALPSAVLEQIAGVRRLIE